MIFLHPLALLALAGAALPALLHLFQRRTLPEADFPPLRYLTEAERRNARRLKLRHLLLLLLRTALIICVVLAAARPLLPTRAPGPGHAPTALAVVVDNSLSAGAVVGGQLTLDRLKSAARSVIARATPDDRLWLVLSDGLARAGSREALLGAVDSAAAESRRLDLVQAVNRAARLVSGEQTTGHAVVVVSDLQRSALSNGRAEIPATVRVTALSPSPEPANRGIASASVTSGAVVVTLAGSAAAGPVPVTLRVGNREVARALASAGSTVSLPLSLVRAGWWVAEVSLEPDELRADDRRVVAWHETEPAGVQVSPEAGPFVAAAIGALRAGGRVRVGADVSIGVRPAASASIVQPPADPALTGEVNRALAARGLRWRFGSPGTPGRLSSAAATGVDGIAVLRRLQLVGTDSVLVLARVNGEPWAIASEGVVLLGSRLDSSWTALPVHPAFVPLLDALVNRFVRGETPIAYAEGAPRVAFTLQGPDTVGVTVFGPDARESDLTVAPPDVVAQAIGAREYDAGELADATFSGAAQAEVTGILLLIALLLALAELAVAALAH